MISAIKLVSIPVKDQNRALEFYTKILGFTLLCDVDFGEKQRWIELKLPEGDTKVSLFTPEGHEKFIGSFSNITFTSHDVHQTYKDLKAKGAEFLHEPKEESWGTFTVLKDSEGNTFCVATPNH